MTEHVHQEDGYFDEGRPEDLEELTPSEVREMFAENGIEQVKQRFPVIGDMIVDSYAFFKPHKRKRSEKEYAENIKEFFRILIKIGRKHWTNVGIIKLIIVRSFTVVEEEKKQLDHQQIESMAGHIVEGYKILVQLAVRHKSS